MAKKEKIHNNEKVQQALKYVTLHTLSQEAKEVMRNLIQESVFLGKNRVPEEDVFCIVSNSPELSEQLTFEHLKLYRQAKGMNYPDSKSAREKYKRIATLVSRAFEQLLTDGVPLNRMTKYKPKQMMTEEQKAAHLKMLDDGVDLQSLIDHLVAMKK
ncbi:hypothetical protein [Citrobacter youngae]|uniref:hypothetical protein n=1 Tax=Citrobacter youngae TaxID=133448 RepID=UPI000E19C164|nr:hypothetical protein [Citrobacter youngae]SUX96155.1 Uncharacterised protein [Citrobacter youngae]